VDQTFGEVGVNAPVAFLVGVSQGGARDTPADAHVIELGVLGAQAGLDVAQALAVAELGEGHAEVLIETGKALDPTLASIAANTASEGMHRQMVYELRKDKLAGVHPTPPPYRQTKREVCMKRRSKFKSMTPQE
jgi:hypothetical protein